MSCQILSQSWSRPAHWIKVAFAILVPCVAASGRLDAQEDPAAACRFEGGEVRAVARVADGETLILDDGAEVRLSGILGPRGQDHGSDAQIWGPEREARKALQDLLKDGRAEIFSTGSSRDRYGRIVAHVTVTAGDKPTWIQGALVDAGHARVTGQASQLACDTELLSREHAARSAKRGLWSNPAYDIRQAWKTRELLAALSTFQIVEGRVAAVAETKSRIYLNFGENWKWDFTASLPLRSKTDRDQTMARLKALQGQTVRVRGWIERRNGPLVELTSPGEIEIVQ